MPLPEENERRAAPARRSREVLAGRAAGLGDQLRRVLDRDREAETLGVARDRGVDADDRTRGVEQRAAAVAGVDRGVGLEEVREARRASGQLVLDGDAAAGSRD